MAVSFWSLGSSSVVFRTVLGLLGARGLYLGLNPAAS